MGSLMIRSARTIHIADDELVRGTFPTVNRKAKRQPPGFRDVGFVLIESTGKVRKDQVHVYVRDAVDARGRKSAPRETVRAVGTDAQMRRPREQDLEPIADKDVEIERATEALHELRKQRAELVETAWRHARGTFTGGDLYALVERTEQRDAAERAQTERSPDA